MFRVMPLLLPNCIHNSKLRLISTKYYNNFYIPILENCIVHQFSSLLLFQVDYRDRMLE